MLVGVLVLQTRRVECSVGSLRLVDVNFIHDSQVDQLGVLANLAIVTELLDVRNWRLLGQTSFDFWISSKHRLG